MADKNLQALKRLIKKLSAVRQVLRNDERAWLDQFVFGDTSEVQGHTFDVKQSRTRPTITLDSDSTYQVQEDRTHADRR